MNAVILLVAVGIIIAESIDKLFHPVSVDGSAIAWTAGVGVVINALTAWLFMKDKDKDLNVKGAYLHMAADEKMEEIKHLIKSRLDEAGIHHATLEFECIGVSCETENNCC